MQKRNIVKLVGLILIFLSLLVFFIEPFSKFTGFSIAENVFDSPSNSIYLPFILFFIAGILLLYFREETPLELSIREAVTLGVPLESAKKIHEESNAKAASGRWVQLRSIGPNMAKNRKYLQGTSLCKYWGPEIYRGLSTRKLTELYQQGKLGKTHEIYRGSNEFSRDKVSHPNKYARVMHRHWEIEQMHKNGINFD